MVTYFLPILTLVAVILIGTSARILREYEAARPNVLLET